MNMKTLLSLSTLLFGLVACSDLGVANTSDSTIPALPADFDAKTYLQINPDLFAPIIWDKAKIANAALGISSVDSVVDDSIFLKDTTTARWIKTKFHIPDNVLDLVTLYSGAVGANPKALISSKFTYNFQGTMDDTTLYKSVFASIDSLSFGDYSYQYTGRFDGHPYRYCVASETTLRDPSQSIPEKGKSGKTFNNYSAHTYCYNATTQQICLIQ